MGLMSVVVLSCCVGCSKDTDIDASHNETNNISVTNVVGAEGGRVEHPNGTRVDIPAGALTDDTPITIDDDDTAAPPLSDGYTLVGPMMAFEPHGETFGADVVLTIPQSSGTMNVDLLRADPGGTWTVVGNISASKDFVQTNTSHFSYYAPVSAIAHQDAGDASSDASSDAIADAHAEMDGLNCENSTTATVSLAASSADLLPGSVDTGWLPACTSGNHCPEEPLQIRLTFLFAPPSTGGTYTLSI
jgi:hypothetical protein